jgi:hypothetical protein
MVGEIPTPSYTTVDGMEREPPTWFISWVKSHAPGSTHVTHEVACIPPQELRTKHRFHMAFGIILNYYSQGLKPLGLASRLHT